MLRDQREKQQCMEIVILEEYVPKDHLLRRIDECVDFSFIYDLCAPLYCSDNGRPAIHPEILFRMLFIGYLYGIKSERRLEEEVNFNMAYKWFCGLGLTEKAPDATTISANRKRRFRDNNIAEQIFDNILGQCVERGLVGCAMMFGDSTHIKAKANKHKKRRIDVEVTPAAYLEELDRQVDQDREALGKKPFERDMEGKEDKEPQTQQKMESTTDPHSGQLSRDGKPDGFHYSEHRMVDAMSNVIVNVHVTAGNVSDVTPMPEILEEVKDRLGKLPKYLGLDAGYHNAPMAHLLEKNGIQGVVGYRRHSRKTTYYGKWKFTYDPETNTYICPNDKRLHWTTTDRDGYREYKASAQDCRNCPHRAQCISAKTNRRGVARHVWQDALDRITAFVKSKLGENIYKLRKQIIEPSFGEAKVNHGLRYARMLGLRNMKEQSFLTAAVQNMKRLVKAFSPFRFVFIMVSPSYFSFTSWPLSAV